MDELDQAVKELSEGKAPRIDGMDTKFYKKKLCPDLKLDLWVACTEILQIGCL